MSVNKKRIKSKNDAYISFPIKDNKIHLDKDFLDKFKSDVKKKNQLFHLFLDFFIEQQNDYNKFIKSKQTKYKLDIDNFNFKSVINDLNTLKKEINLLKEKIDKFDYVPKDPSTIEKNNNLISSKENQINSQIRRIFKLMGGLKDNTSWQSMSIEKNIYTKGIFQFDSDLGKMYNRSILTESKKEEHFAELLKEKDTSKRFAINSVLCSSGMGCHNIISELLMDEINKKGILFPNNCYHELKVINRFRKKILYPNGDLNTTLKLIKKHRPVAIMIEPISNCYPIKIFDLKKFLKNLASYPFLRYILIDSSSNFSSFNLLNYEINLSKDQAIFELKSLLKSFQYGYDLASSGLINIICNKEDYNLCDIIRFKLFLIRGMGLGLSTSNYYSLPIYNERINTIRNKFIYRNNRIISYHLSRCKFKRLNFVIDSPSLKISDYRECVPFFYLKFNHKHEKSLNILFYLVNKEVKSPVSTGASYGFNSTRMDVISLDNIRISVGQENIIQAYQIINNLKRRLVELDSLLEDQDSFEKFNEIRELLYDTATILFKRQINDNKMKIKVKEFYCKMACILDGSNKKFIPSKNKTNLITPIYENLLEIKTIREKVKDDKYVALINQLIEDCAQNIFPKIFSLDQETSALIESLVKKRN